MSQQILFKRSLTTFNSRAEAVSKFDSLTWNAGEPVIANYIDQGVTRVLFAIGIANLVGSQGYRIISDFETVGQLTTALSNLSTALGEHEDVLATGTGEDAVAGHVINSDESDIEFTDGIGKLKAGSLALESLTKSATSGIIGYKSIDVVNDEASASLMSWSDVLTELRNSNLLKIFSGIKIGKSSVPEQNRVSVIPSQLGATLSITTDDNITVTSNGNDQFHISLNANLGEIGAELKTVDEKQPIIISGTTTGIVTEFNSKGVKLPSGSTATTVQIGSSHDTTSSEIIATVGYVSQKINSVLESNDAMHYMGTLDPTVAEFALPAGNAGDTYKISVGGEIEGLGSVHAGDMIICNSDNTLESTPTNWDVVEVHDGSLIAPEGISSGNIIAFGGGNEVIDTKINYNNIITTAHGIKTGAGLTGGGTLGSDITISHESVTTVSEGTGNLITGIEVNAQGHVTKILKGSIDESSLTLKKEGINGSWSSDNAYVTSGYTICGISLESGVLTAYAAALPGLVRAANNTKLKYIEDVIAGKSGELADNEYAITTSRKDDVVELSVKIDKIDGGIF
jgi:hypothetical protein